MTTNYGSLLALDSFTDEESMRVAIYSRALELSSIQSNSQSPQEIAQAFLDFVGGERWKLDVLDVALKGINRRSTLGDTMKRVADITSWVRPTAPVIPSSPVLSESPTPAVVSELAVTFPKKAGEKKR